MISRDYYELFRFLAEQYCLPPDGLLFVEDIPAWCRDRGIPESDHERPLKIVLDPGEGCKMLVREDIRDTALEERINGLRIRGQLRNVAFDRADMLNADRKKLAYLFLSEYATTLPAIRDDELAADDWAFEEMERLGFFKA